MAVALLQLLLPESVQEVQRKAKEGPGLGSGQRLPQLRDRSEKHRSDVALNQVFGQSQHEDALAARYKLQQEVYH